MLFGDEVINTERLTVPHYDMKNRGFMLWPLVEIAPELLFLAILRSVLISPRITLNVLLSGNTVNFRHAARKRRCAIVARVTIQRCPSARNITITILHDN